MAFLPMAFLPMAILPMAFLPMAFLPHTVETGSICFAFIQCWYNYELCLTRIHCFEIIFNEYMACQPI